MNAPYDIDGLLEDVVTLPSLPATVAGIMRLVNDPDCALSAVAKAISADPPLAIKTLRLVNAAYYGLRQKVGTIEHAVALLGIKVIKNLVFTATVFDIMKGEVDVFFRHSVSCGVVAQVFATASGAAIAIDSVEEAFLYGLLHDIGKVVFGEFLPEETALVAQVSAARQIPWRQAEREVIGIDHAELGARLAQNWKLPQGFIDAIAGHHDLTQCQDPQYQALAALIGTADYVCGRCGVGTEEAPVLEMHEAMWEASGLVKADLPAVMSTVFEKLPSVDELMRSVE